MNRLPPLNSLKAFEAAGRWKSFTLAAAELHVTSGAVSRHVLQLEEWLGATLFIRNARGVELTQEGATYLGEASEALHRLANATSRVLQGRKHDVLLVNATSTFALRWLIPKLSKFQLLHPNIEVRLGASNELIENISTPFDIAIRAGHPDNDGYRSVEILSSIQVPFCSPRILVEHPINCARDLAHHTLLRLTKSKDGWADWLAEAGAADLQPLRSVSFDEGYMAIQAAVDGLGLSIMPFALVADDIAAGRLTAPLSSPVLSSWHYRAHVAKERAHEPAIMQFLEWLQTTAQQSSGAPVTLSAELANSPRRSAATTPPVRPPR